MRLPERWKEYHVISSETTPERLTSQPRLITTITLITTHH